MRRPTLADRVMNEELNYGGMPTRRIDVIRDLEAKGLTPEQVNWYMFCLGERHNREQGLTK